MGFFAGLFGDGGAAERAANVAADAARAARDQLRKDTETYQGYYQPYMNAGNAAAGNQSAVLGGVQSRINAIDPKIAALYAERAGLQPQVGEMYSLSKQQDPVIQEILGGGKNFTASPGYQFMLEEDQKALERSRAANRTLNTGQTGKELIKYSQGMASREYGNYMNSLYNQLGSINTQLGGRGTALNAGQNQVNSGINLLGADMNQVTQEQQLAQQYQALINSGFSAADASAKLGLSSSGAQGGYTQSAGNATASGMQATSNSLASVGNSWLNLAAALGSRGATSAMPGGGPFQGGVSNQNFGGYGSQPTASIQPYNQSGGIQNSQSPSFLGGMIQGVGQGYQNYGQPQIGANIPTWQQGGYVAPQWQNPDVAQAAQISSQSGFKSRYPTLGGY